MNKDTKEWSEQWLSPARLSPYFEVCGRDPELALDLYLWNVGLCQVLVADFSHFEVALRNAYDRTLCVNWNGRDYWLLDDSSPVRTPIMRLSKSKQLLDVNVANRKAISQAQNRCYDPSNPNQVISNLMMGFWSHLTDRSRERDLWIPYLHNAWPIGIDRAELHQTISAINKVRNRVAHNERLFNPKSDAFLPAVVDANLIRLLHYLSPEAAWRLYGNDGVTSVERYCVEHPVPTNVAL